MAGLLRNIQAVGGDSMSKKSTPTKMKVMHVVSKDGNGKPTIHSVVSNPPKLKEATDKVQQAEETAHKTTKADKPKNEMTDEQRAVLQALHDLGGKDKDIHSMDIAVKLGFDKSHKDAPRAPVRNAMKNAPRASLRHKQEGRRQVFLPDQ
jgi:hypothetical protein